MSLLSTRGLSVNFGGIRALVDVHLDVEQGTVFGLIGPNGAGKTTFVNLVSGLIRPTSGSLEFDGQEGGPWPIAKAVRRGIVRTFQQSRAYLELTVAENLNIAAAMSARAPRIEEIVEEMEFGALLPVKAGNLTYPQLRRLGIALALMLEPKLLLLDEPAVGLTEGELDKMASIVRARQAQGTTILLIEHNVRFLMSLAQRVGVLHRGQMIFQGTPAECQANPLVIEAYLGKRYADAGD